MTTVVVAVILLIGGALGRALLADEIRGWVNRFPGWLLRKAAKYLGPDDQAIYEELWLPDLKFILREDRPITRLLKATRMAAGLLVETRREACGYRRVPVEETATEDAPIVLAGDPGQLGPVSVSPPQPGVINAAGELSGMGNLFAFSSNVYANAHVRLTLEQMERETRRRISDQ